jgi:Zn-dependent peptidase ImmA (M78 family)
MAPRVSKAIPISMPWKDATSKGRINFTLGHELGHYLLHRHLSPEGFRCSSRDMLDWKSEHGQIEAQANPQPSPHLLAERAG